MGLRPGMAVAQALTIVPGLEVAEAEPASDADALRRLALWCHRVTPLASPDPPSGVWLDIAGCAHLHETEAGLVQTLLARFARDGLHARAGVADTPGAAHALARFAAHEGPAFAPPGDQAAAIAPLPVAALRLAPETEATLRRLGFEEVAHLARIPRAMLARRFGTLLCLRLDQAHGRAAEPLVPLPPDRVLQQREAFLEPLLTAEAFTIAIQRLADTLCAELERHGLGARQADLLFERVDHQVAAIRIGTARPTRDPRHLARLLGERLEMVDPGLGVEAMRLVVGLAEPLVWEQQDGGAAPQDTARLVDRLANRLGPDRVYSATPVESALPERMVGRIGPEGSDPRAHMPTLDDPIELTPGTVHVLHQSNLALAIDEDPPALPWRKPWSPPEHKPTSPEPWPGRLQAPARLLHPPRPIQAIAALPDQPPVAFTWRRRHRVRRADGPERVHLEWWLGGTPGAVRDYFQVEDETGQRFWLFRNGDGLDPSSGDLSWFIHGLF